MAQLTWKELDEKRAALPKRLSRAEMARRAGLSESTINKGIRFDRTPTKATRQQILLVLNAEELMIEEGLR